MLHEELHQRCFTGMAKSAKECRYSALLTYCKCPFNLFLHTPVENLPHSYEIMKTEHEIISILLLECNMPATEPRGLGCYSGEWS